MNDTVDKADEIGYAIGDVNMFVNKSKTPLHPFLYELSFGSTRKLSKDEIKTVLELVGNLIFENQ